jgi:hypothetical protein
MATLLPTLPPAEQLSTNEHSLPVQNWPQNELSLGNSPSSLMCYNSEVLRYSYLYLPVAKEQNTHVLD